MRKNEMHVHILGICGTFMSGVAMIAKQLGFEVTGSDEACYPPMSTQLELQGIELMEGYDPEHLKPAPDRVIIGNAMTRGNPAVETVLNEHLPFESGPSFLAKYALRDRWVLAVSGTHGKTTTASMVAWILEYAGQNPSFLIGGIPRNFDASARLTESKYFVLEADEYDTAFFDKRAKFIHFHPKTLVINRLEFDHADIYDNLDQIKRQFHYLVRTVPGNGQIFVPVDDANVQDVLEEGCWTPVETFGYGESSWSVADASEDGSQFNVLHAQKALGQVNWDLLGRHNVENALAAIASCHHAGVDPEVAIAALNHFQGVKRRLEMRGVKQGVTVYDDFAHHPTAIATTLAGLRKKIGEQRLIVIAEFASYTMRNGYHVDKLPEAFANADSVLLLRPANASWDIEKLASQFVAPTKVFNTVPEILADIKKTARSGDHICVMSNRGFDKIHERLLAVL